jgi:hypothetical protein
MKRGYTLFELLVWVGLVLAVVFVFGGILVASCSGALGIDYDAATKEAEAWTTKMGLKGQIDCARTDSDNDGYVSCTLVVKKENGDTEIVPLECAKKYAFNSGCRMQKMGYRK